MQFIAKGPDVPDALIQAHEKGEVVFFCGAGISRRVGLPDFKGLVQEVAQRLEIRFNQSEDDAFKRRQFDILLNSLEQRLTCGAFGVRKQIATVLRMSKESPSASSTHRALLSLARNRDNVCRLVTTNYDRIFCNLPEYKQWGISSHAAPLLPIPNNHDWNGLVYLHGLLPIDDSRDELNKLIITSADFGRAYLLESWAARFVTELFRSHKVCFIGYSIGDQVLRYFVDALESERRMGETRPRAYAFVGCRRGQRESDAAWWKARGIEPILYDLSPTRQSHSALHQTLQGWADQYVGGTRALESVVERIAPWKPTLSSKEDDFVGRLIHAICHASGIPAKKFADFKPAPAIEWLEHFEAARFNRDDCIRFGFTMIPEAKEDYRFSLLNRPLPASPSRPISLFSWRRGIFHLDAVQFHIERWLTRHLNDSRLFHWACRNGDTLSDSFATQIERCLAEIEGLEKGKEEEKLREIGVSSPNGLPSPVMRCLWRTLARGQIKTLRRERDSFTWKQKFLLEGLTATTRLELRNLMKPLVSVDEPWRWLLEPIEESKEKKLKDIARVNLTLQGDHIRNLVTELVTESLWTDCQKLLIYEYQQLLLDALDLWDYIHAGEKATDPGLWQVASIGALCHNDRYEDWTLVVELLRDSWGAVSAADRQLGELFLMQWIAIEYPLFKRLAIFGASQTDCCNAAVWCTWLLKNDGQCLWAVNYEQEVLELLRLRNGELSATDRNALDEVIRKGPSSIQGSSKNGDEFNIWRNRCIRDRLRALSAGAGAKQEEDGDNEGSACESPGNLGLRSGETEIVPERREDLLKWLQRDPTADQQWGNTPWAQFCAKRVWISSRTLAQLSQQDIWPERRWREAFLAWSTERLAVASWRFVWRQLPAMPDSVMSYCAEYVAIWVGFASKKPGLDRNVFVAVCRRLLALECYQGELEDDPYTRAINHPIGHVIRALLSSWLSEKPGDNSGLPHDLRQEFSRVCTTHTKALRHGRVILASNVVALFRVDPEWTCANLLPLFSWKADHQEATSSWSGLLWAARPYAPLLLRLQDEFLETSNHYSELGRVGSGFANLIVYLALEPLKIFPPAFLRDALSNLPPAGFAAASAAALEAMNATQIPKAEFWHNRLEPFFKKVWPKEIHAKTSGVAFNLACISALAEAAFPEAVNRLLDWLVPIGHAQHVLNHLIRSEIPRRYPSETLDLFDAIVDVEGWVSHQLRTCLDQIVKSSEQYRSDPRFRRLDEICRVYEV